MPSSILSPKKGRPYLFRSPAGCGLPSLLAESVSLGFRRPPVRLMAGPWGRARSVKGVSASFPDSFGGPSQKAEGPGPIQQHLGSGAYARNRHDENRHDEIATDVHLTGVGDKTMPIDSNSSSIAAAGNIVTNMLLKLNDSECCRCEALGPA
jgi:hypothetical protein